MGIRPSPGKLALIAALFVSLAAGCSERGAPSVRLALDGPPLLVAAKNESRVMSGVMDRSCMAGVGGLILYDEHAKISCQGTMDSPASDKGRMYIDLICSDGATLTFVMRNLGPDQGMGVGKFAESGEGLTMFYHPCENEASRRLDLLLKDLGAAIEKKKQREKEKAEE